MNRLVLSTCAAMLCATGVSAQTRIDDSAVAELYPDLGFEQTTDVVGPYRKMSLNLPATYFCGRKMTNEACFATAGEVGNQLQNRPEVLEHTLKTSLVYAIDKQPERLAALSAYANTSALTAEPICTAYPTVDERCGVIISASFNYIGAVILDAQADAKKSEQVIAVVAE